jgi:hypothetical protein
MKCANCGAAVAAGVGRFCSHCGAVLADAPRLRADEYRTHPERFAAVRAAADYPDAMAYDPGRGVTPLEFILPLGLMAFGGYAVRHGLGSMPREQSLLVNLFMIVWFGALGFSLLRAVAAAAAPLERVIAVVVNSRTSISSHRHNRHRHSSTEHYVTVEREDSRRTEYRTGGKTVGLVCDPDIGVADVRARRLLDFRRFDA